jgi:RNA polymerase sigma factor (sigma-70 family)
MAEQGDGSALTDAGLLRAFTENRGDLVRFLARRLKCLFTACDLTQEVYLRSLRVDASAAVENPRALLFQIASNLATDHQRVEARRAQLLQEAHYLLWAEADVVTPERQALARDVLQRIDAALQALPERTRLVFYLNRFEGLTQREISLRLGIARTNVEKHMRRALQCIAEERARLEAETIEIITKRAETDPLARHNREKREKERVAPPDVKAPSA